MSYAKNPNATNYKVARWKSLTEDEEKEIIEKYLNEDIRVKDIVKEYGLQVNNIPAIMRKNGIPLRKSKGGVPREVKPEKACKTCGVVYPLDKFAKSDKTADGTKAHCLPCWRIYHRLNCIKQQTGKTMTYDEYKAMEESCDNKCMICNQPETQINGRTREVQSLAIDHCHDSNKIRGLLCSHCNTTLGKFNDDIAELKRFKETVDNMITYLEKHTK